MRTSDPRFLSRTLWADALCCASAGALQWALVRPLAACTGLSRPLLLGTGGFLLAWACVAAWGALRMPHSRRLVAVAISGNFGWAAACLVLLGGGWLTSLPAGQAWVLGQAAIGAALGGLQCAGLWRSRWPAR
ncbi:Uncharacterised protein [Delftia tsuruhatensis]|uniref:hypothetical protein n=1 Tax=Delftia tsuruhatensis TaxID=180282 RepID=UPI001E703D20|nr:hypothetical protein [Delftia tsuruhatensis]CAB5722099.1 Uncharacterised protein [Delftia tsuruhatensis]CAC9688581.1 Uncharacterised protein [Delftia tsuruhatensis]